jgi:cysteine desulfurase/selenocysteine lyase
MVKSVKKNSVQYSEPPERFEAGTPNIAGAVGLAAAVEYLEEIGRDSIHEHEKRMAKTARGKLRELEGVELVGPGEGTIVSFTAEWAHPHDVAEILGQEAVAVRAGHHCAQPEMESKGKSSGTVRVSPYLYNTREDVEKLADAVRSAKEVFE